MDSASSGLYTQEPTFDQLTGSVAPDPALQNAIGQTQAAQEAGMLGDAEIKKLNNSEQGRKIVSWIKKEYTRAQNDRRQFERQWALNLAFYAGRQYVQWDRNESKLTTQPAINKHTPRIVVNKIQPIIRTEMAKLTGQKPTATVMPASNDDRDVFAAVAASQVWDSLYQRLNFPKKLSRAVFWLSITGTAYVKTFWDPSLLDTTSGLYGDINWTVLSPWSVQVADVVEQDLENQAWVMDVQTRPCDWVEAVYGQFFPKGVKPTTTRTDEVLSSAGVALNQPTQQKDHVVIQEIWIKPDMCAVLPDGGMITLIDDVIVQACTTGIPYEHKEYPFAKLEHIPTGRYYCTSTIEPLIPLQREYNRTQSQIIEAKNRTSKPQMMFREGAVDPTKITSAPGVWIPIKGSADYPQPMPLTELPSYVTQFNDRQQSDFEDISGQHSTTKGTAPAGTPATGIAYLQEQDDAYLATTFQSIEQAIEKVANQSLAIAATYWTVPRLIKATGEDGGYDAIELKGSDFASATDIKIDSGSALATSPSAKQAQVTDWMKMGWIPPSDGFELLDMPMTQQWVAKRSADKKAAQYENIQFRQLDPEQVQEWSMEQAAKQEELLQQHLQQAQSAVTMDPTQGLQVAAAAPPAPAPGHPANPVPFGSKDPLGLPAKPTVAPQADGTLQTDNPGELPCLIPVNDWDDHAVHIQIHNLWRKSPSYRLVSPVVRNQVQLHVALHQKALLQQQMPAPEPGGAPSAPPPGGGGTPAGEPFDPNSPVQAPTGAPTDDQPSGAPAGTPDYSGMTENQLQPQQ